MTIYADITNFTDWFFSTVWGLGTDIFNKMDSIILNTTYNVSLLDFSIILLFASIIFTIVLNAPGVGVITKIGYPKKEKQKKERNKK